MNCTFHIQKQISLICVAPHKCKCNRKLCAECVNTHEVDVKYLLAGDQFREVLIKKLQDYNLKENEEFINQSMNFKSVISQTEVELKKVWQQLTESIQQIYNMIDQENNSFMNIINNNQNLTESSYTDLDKLVQIFEGTKLNVWNIKKKSYLIKLEQLKKWWGQEIKTFNEMVKKQMKEILSVEFISLKKEENQNQKEKNHKIKIQEIQLEEKKIEILPESFTKLLKFSHNYKSNNCSISDGGKIAECGSGSGFIICEQVIPKVGITKFAFQVIEIYASLYFGIGMREIIKEKGFEFGQNSGLNSGAYLIANDSNVFSNHDPNIQSQILSFQFGQNDIIIIEVNMDQRNIKWTKVSSSIVCVIDIDTSKELYPCAFLHSKSKIQILNDIPK